MSKSSFTLDLYEDNVLQALDYNLYRYAFISSASWGQGDIRQLLVEQFGDSPNAVAPIALKTGESGALILSKNILDETGLFNGGTNKKDLWVLATKTNEKQPTCEKPITIGIFHSSGNDDLEAVLRHAYKIVFEGNDSDSIETLVRKFASGRDTA